MTLTSKLVSWFSKGDYDQRLVKWMMLIQSLLLGLSLFHQSRAVANVTGMNILLAFLQSLVTDGGLFIAELTLIRFLATSRSVLWTATFVCLVAVASAGANVYDFTSHLEPGSWPWRLAFVYGVSIPIQVLLLGKVISQLVMPKKKSPVVRGKRQPVGKSAQSDTTRDHLRVAR